MSAENRTPEEYTEIFAKQNHKTIEQAKKCIAVSLFTEYARERDLKHDNMDSSR